jgi:mannose-6-phosphate isomerase-like protein (cupin superfamily)
MRKHFFLLKKGCLVILSALLFSQFAVAQKVNTSEISKNNPYQPVYVQALFGDSLCTSLYIEINKDVPAHFHKLHSEHVYILSGEGMMTLGQEKFPIKAGDFIFIPSGTIHSVDNINELPLRALSIQAPQFDGQDRVLIIDEP